MAVIHLYAYVEDKPTKVALRRIIEYVNTEQENKFCFAEGFPVVKDGWVQLQKSAQKFINAAKNGTWGLFVTDLDKHESPSQLLNDWFNLQCFKQLPQRMLFRVAVHEIESWILADHSGIAHYFGVSTPNFSEFSDDVADPKHFLFSIIDKKCKKKKFKGMLPVGRQSIGLDYNSYLIEFIEKDWNIENAIENSPSLKRMIDRFIDILNRYSEKA